MSFLVSEESIEDFDKNGAICLRNVFSKKWIDSISNGIAKNLQQPSSCAEWLEVEGGKGCYFDDYCNWRKIKEFEDFIFLSPAAQISALLTRSSYAAIYHEHVLIKEPGTMKETPWHQDQAYYPIDGYKVCSIWMPVDSIPEETCVQFIAGSHKWDWYFPKKFATDLPYERSQQLDRIFKAVPQITSEHTILKWSLEPGDCIVFHMRTIHGAPGNQSLERRRRVLSTRWLGDDAVIAARPWEVSPPTFGGLKIGDKAVSSEFPIIWTRNNDQL